MNLTLTAAERRAASLAALLGNALEWFDFAVYGYVATSLGKTFYPTDRPGLQAVAAFGVFAVGYLMRPVGSLVLGPMGDLLGRRPMLSLSILLMGSSSFLISILPTHAQIGDLAGWLLLVLRMVQGFSVGGEFTGSMTYATEAAPRGKEGLVSAMANAGGLLGFSLGSLTVAMLSHWLGNAAMDAWGWRLPFALGGSVAVLGLWMRRRMPETLVLEVGACYSRQLNTIVASIIERLRDVQQQMPTLVRIGALVSFANVMFYVLFVFLVDFVSHSSTSTMAEANVITTIVQIIGLPIVLLGGLLVDRFGKLPVNRWGNLMIAGVIPIALPLAQQGGSQGLAIAQMLGVAPVMITMGAQGVMAVELVPAKQRCTVFSISYSLAMAIFAGTAPLICSWLLVEKGLHWGPVIYCLIFALPALWAVHYPSH
jgi:MHS family proline/betaine transporter-like MFS transporter